jgi:hypothetical protein
MGLTRCALQLCRAILFFSQRHDHKVPLILTTSLFLSQNFVSSARVNCTMWPQRSPKQIERVDRVPLTLRLLRCSTPRLRWPEKACAPACFIDSSCYTPHILSTLCWLFFSSNSWIVTHCIKPLCALLKITVTKLQAWIIYINISTRHFHETKSKFTIKNKIKFHAIFTSVSASERFLKFSKVEKKKVTQMRGDKYFCWWFGSLIFLTSRQNQRQLDFFTNFELDSNENQNVV